MKGQVTWRPLLASFQKLRVYLIKKKKKSLPVFQLILEARLVELEVDSLAVQ